VTGARPFSSAREANGASSREWLPFSLGGGGQWSQVRTRAAVAEALGLEREAARLVRTADGGFEIAAIRLPCEVLRNQLRLPSCPEEVVATDAGYTFRGKGEGHGAGLDLTGASAAAAEGADFQALLASAWPGLRVVPSPSPER
jgi:peptidoglycan hydrolase-like amidase